MSQDTRKDKRAKVVSLNVRYKSATVDEFIENHSHDVSKGGIFVKTPTPFPPGTLLKFEIRLAGDMSVISGVGRVVWKREPTQAASDKPAGMGVKFINIDDASRVVIDKLVASKADAGSAYTSDPAALEEEKPGPNPTTLRGIAVAPPSNPPVEEPSGQSITVPPPKAAPAPAVGTSGANARPPGAQAAGLASMQKTIPLGTSPLAGLPPFTKATPAAPSVAPKPSPAGGPPAPMAHKPQTVLGVGAPKAITPAAPPVASAASQAPAPPPSPASPASLAPRPGAAAAATASSAASGPPRPPAVNPRKATMMGVALPASGSAPGAQPGAAAAAAAAAAAQSVPAEKVPSSAELPTPMVELTPRMLDELGHKAPAPAPAPAPAAGAAASPMFPKMEESRRDMDSVKEPTVMKQAAELLEEALREAGGSLEEIGSNPLFQKDAQKQDESPDSLQQSGDTLMMTTPFAPKTASVPPSSPQPSSSVSPSAERAKSVPPASAVSAKSVPPAPLKPVGASVAPAEKKGNGGLIAALVVVAAVVGGGLYAVRSGMLGGTPPASTAPAPSEIPSALPAESAKPVAITDAAVAPVEDASPASAIADAAAVVAVKDAAAAVEAPASAAPVVTAPPVVKPKPKPKPKPTATPTEEPGEGDPPSPAPAPTPTEKPAPPPEE